MTTKAFAPDMSGLGSVGRLLVAIALSTVLGACAKGPPPLPEPRPVVIRSGERLYADPEKMAETDTWFRAQRENIETDPGFWIITAPRDSVTYPWESLYMSSDSATFSFPYGFDDARTVYEIYAHYRLMKKLGRIGEFLPDGEDLEGFSLEKAILERVADAWFLGRSVYEAAAYEPLEEILYSNENGYLEALILTARGEEFEEERRAWLEEDPEAPERYRQWFLATFSREPPGLRGKG
jgi:hypothetical protein